MTPNSRSSQIMRSVKTHNPLPTYIEAKKVVSEELAEKLISLVNERGSHSDWALNPRCLEYQIANPFSRIQVEYDERVSECLPELYGLAESFMRHANWNFNNTIIDTITGHHGFWILRYDDKGEFTKHCDWESGPMGIRPPIVATAAVLLNEDFEGGETVLFDSRGDEAIIDSVREKFSAYVWDGFTQHEVKRVTKGSRYALVIHYTGMTK